MSLLLLRIPSPQGSVMEAADDFYDYNGYGQGPDRDGLILYVCMDTRDIWISTLRCGDQCIYRLRY